MLDTDTKDLTFDPYNGLLTDYIDATNTNLIDRWRPLADWLTHRASVGLDSYCKANAARIGRQAAALDRSGNALSGVNFASQDYLSLSSHPAILDAAQSAAGSFGVHSAGSTALMGLTTLTLGLESRMARFLQLTDATVFPTGWGAGYGAIRTLVRPGDHVLLDLLAHACLHEAAEASTPNVHRFPHLSTDGVARRLKRVRAEDPSAGILVVTEGMFSMDSDTPDIAALQDLCRTYGATLFVDVAHDLGAIGPGGTGALGEQGLLGEVDVVMGSFSKTFASNGGFVATNNTALKLALRFACGPQTFTNAISPVQAATVLCALDIVDGPEGENRRAALMRNAVRLRNGLEAAGFEVLGRAGPIVPVKVGANRAARLMTRGALASGAMVNLIEYPAVAKHACRWRLQVMADHTDDDIDQFLAICAKLRRDLKSEF